MVEGWKQGELGDCIKSITSGKSVNSTDEPVHPDEKGILKTSCVLDNKFSAAECKKIVVSERSLAKCPVKGGSLIVSRMNTAKLVGACGLVKRDYPNLFLPDRLWAVKPELTTDVNWLYFVVTSHMVQQRLAAGATGTSGTMKNISQEMFASTPIKIPPFLIQRKIAEILSTWEEALEKLNELTQSKRTYLDHLRMRLLFDDSVVSSKLSNFTEELTQRNLNIAIPRSRVMAVTKAEGVVPMREQTIAADIARYKQVPPQAFAYNPMRINVGSIAKNEHEETVLVSPDYVVFKCLPDLLHPRYLEHLRKTDWWSHYINSGGSGSVRQRTYYSDLAALRPPVPPIERQIEIVNILDAAAKEIALIEQQITAIERQKRGLMQKLLTGEWRVRAEAQNGE